MAAKKGGLGKGLDALFADNATEDAQGAVKMRVSEIEPNKAQPRKTFDEKALTDLAESIAQHGILQPLLVRPLPNGGYQLVAGERRWRASRMAGLTEVPVIIRELTDKETMELALIENLQREDLNPIEEAEGLQLLMENYGLTQEEASKRVGRSRPAVANSLRLLNLPEPVQEMTRMGRISAGHARALLAFEDTDKLIETARMVATQDISVREVERLSKKAVQEPSKRVKKEERRASYYTEVELALTETLGRKVKVSGGKGKGTLEIEFYSMEDLADLANRLGAEE